ncbi:Holliday junction resolvase RuvX [Enterobacteriaceae endosymbiont of Donacia bicoloricornis]|uniref:Holliday junction resolvase RuvX n=1 Tax=Enterobacteriaceae endosymbiont of Donacia bicoloricornis TaxID=2675772 RepID=UPI001449DD34|nr:Holliday junction resolvase RuvX [Enterobacteriaceae endosymbiont of Donacia bicoloricornis]QJC37798.1 Holliday junction resolvase RuvX [Enterobacteriaceae endosymbiont of Donacia bicoloricornis]
MNEQHNNNITLLAFDYGVRNIGVAVGHSLIRIAHKLKVIKNKKIGNIDWMKFDDLINQWKPKKIIVGLPLKMDGSQQYTTVLAKNFAFNIKKKFNIEIIFHDERLSTVEAKYILFSKGGWKKLKTDDINSLSACIILQSWFENN